MADGKRGHAIVEANLVGRNPLDAAGEFHSEYVARVKAAAKDGARAVTVILPHSGTDHDDWRRATARDLARAIKPVRVNIICGDVRADIETACAYLADAPGITGQYLPLHEKGE